MKTEPRYPGWSFDDFMEELICLEQVNEGHDPFLQNMIDDIINTMWKRFPDECRECGMIGMVGLR